MADNYNIKIDTQVQLEEIKALLTELRSISAEISKINGLTFSAVSASAAELSKTSKDLAEALKAQKDAVDNLPTSTERASDGIRELGESVEKTEKEIDRAKTATQGFYMEQYDFAHCILQVSSSLLNAGTLKVIKSTPTCDAYFYVVIK